MCAKILYAVWCGRYCNCMDKRIGSRREGNRGAGRGREVPVKDVSERGRSRKGRGKFFERFQEGGDESIRLTRDGFLKLRSKWDSAREKCMKGDTEIGNILNQFPLWVKNVPHLLETLRPLIQNENADHGDFLYVMEKEGFVGFDIAKRLFQEEGGDAEQEDFVAAEIQRVERESVAEEEREERVEMLKGKILERLKEVYAVSPKEVFVTEHPPHASPHIMQVDKDKWGEEIPRWGRIHDTAATTRSIYTEAVIVGDDVHILDINEYGEGPVAVEVFIASHKEGKPISLHFYERGKIVREGRTATRFEGEISSLIIYDPESYLSGTKAGKR